MALTLRALRGLSAIPGAILYGARLDTRDRVGIVRSTLGMDNETEVADACASIMVSAARGCFCVSAGDGLLGRPSSALDDAHWRQLARETRRAQP